MNHTLTDMNINGCGILRPTDGPVIFVPYTADGDQCELSVEKTDKNYSIARCERVVTPSKFRCDPVCSSFGKCGGCSLRHITYSHELKIKMKSVAQAFRKNSMTVFPEKIIPTTEESYRNKAVFHVSEGKLCYFVDKSHDGVYPESGRCMILPQIFDGIREYVQSNPILPEGASLYLRMGDGQSVMVCFVGMSGKTSISEYVKELTEHFPCITSVYTADRSISLPNVKFAHIWGEESLYITVSDLKFSVHPASFFQVNIEGCARLCETVCEFVSGSSGNITDLYCGSGMFALTLAKRYPERNICGIEINKEAISYAKINAKRNGIENARFFAGDAASFPEKLRNLDYCTVDPPRAGLSRKAKSLLLDAKPENIVYVSCNPETLARDVRELSEEYELCRIVCVDMFPRSSHVETACLLTRKHTEHRMKLNAEQFQMISSGQKTVELRLLDEKRQKLKVGDTIVFTCNDKTERTVKVQIAALHCFENFAELYRNLPLLKCGYTKENVSEAHFTDMEAYYSTEEQKKYGVVGIEILPAKADYR